MYFLNQKRLSPTVGVVGEQHAASTIGQRLILILIVGISLLISAGHARAALAELEGDSGYSADLSSNRHLRRQQLIVDPNPGNGSASVTYDPNLVSLTSAFNETNYLISQGYVGVLVGNVKEVEQITSYFSSPLPQWGYVQIQWSYANGTAAMTYYNTEGATPDPPAGYTTISSSGPAGANTFGLQFNYLPPDGQAGPDPSYTVYAESTGYPIYNGGGTSPTDYITPLGNPNDHITTIDPATASGPVPEPSCLVLIGFATLSALWRRRARPDTVISHRLDRIQPNNSRS